MAQVLTILSSPVPLVGLALAGAGPVYHIAARAGGGARNYPPHPDGADKLSRSLAARRLQNMSQPHARRGFYKSFTRRRFLLMPFTPTLTLCREGNHQKGTGKDMEQLVEFYEMASRNKAALSAAEKRSLSQARRALGIFEKAMQDVRRNSARFRGLERGLAVSAGRLEYRFNQGA